MMAGFSLGILRSLGLGLSSDDHDRCVVITAGFVGGIYQVLRINLDASCFGENITYFTVAYKICESIRTQKKAITGDEIGVKDFSLHF